MNLIRKSAAVVAESAAGNPVFAVLVVILFYIMLNIVMSSVERLVFGERFEHYLDPLIGCIFIAYAAHVVYACAVFNSK